MLRLFIAVELSEQQKQELAKLQNKVSQYLDGVRWAKHDAMHLTLKFLGDTEESRIEQIREAMELVAKQQEPFLLSFGGSGVFPNSKKARVLWVGVEEGEKEIKLLAEELEKSLSDYGFQKEKRAFYPHLTTGRLRNPPPQAKIQRYLDNESSFISSPVEVKEAVLFQSKLLPHGPEYSILHRKSFVN